MTCRVFRAFLVVLAGLCSPALQPLVQTAAGDAARTKARSVGEIAALRLTFEANEGQSDPRVKFLAHAGGDTLFLAGSEAVLALRGGETDSRSAVLRMRFVGANAEARVDGVDKLPGRTNYLIGNDRTKWRTNVTTYQKVEYHQIYPGIGAVFYGNPRQLEYDFVVAPGADPGRIRLDVKGAQRIVLDEQGDIVLRVANRDIRMRRPMVYQTAEGERREIAAGYTLKGHEVRFRLAAYDRRRPLVIDPVLAYSTYLGGNGRDNGSAIAVDSADKVYVTGFTGSLDFPGAAGGPYPPSAGTYVAFVTKLDLSQSGAASLVYSTYLGGSSSDQGLGIAVDGSGNAYVAGVATSQNFPVTATAFQLTSSGGTEAFMTKLNAAGNGLLYSTYFGGIGNDSATAIAVDGSGAAYINGQTYSQNLPVTPGSFQQNGNGVHSAFVAKFDPAQSGQASLVYSTYLGGSHGVELGRGIAVDAVGNAYVTGYTNSDDFPTLNAVQPTFLGSPAAFVTSLNSSGTALRYSTYLGGKPYASEGHGIAVDAAGNAYIAGTTGAVAGNSGTVIPFPVTAGAFQSNSIEQSATVTKLDAAGALVYSTYLGSVIGTGATSAEAIGVDGAGNAYVTGYTSATDFPVTADAFQSVLKTGTATTHFTDAFVAKLDPSRTGAASLIYSTYLGGNGGEFNNSVLTLYGFAGIAVNAAGIAYVTGATESADFPVTTSTATTASAYQSTYAGSIDAFVAKIAPTPACSVTPGTWTPTGSMPFGLTRHTATRLANGKVLIAGGLDTGTSLDNPLGAALLYDPAGGTFTATGSMSTPRFRHTATLLPNGKVLIAGGVTTGSGGVCTNTAELYDPSANNGAGAFTSTGAMNQFRADYTATLLPNGKVLLAGGSCSGGQSAELFDPAANNGAGAFVPTGSMSELRVDHTATLLSNGTVLVTGGADTINQTVPAAAEIYDPASSGGLGAFSTTGSMLNPRYGQRATLLPSGRVLITGGLDFTLNPFAAAEIFDAVTGRFITTGSLATARYDHTATRLANGQVLIAGGRAPVVTGFEPPLNSAELYDEAAAGGGAFLAVAQMGTRRENFSATLLADGTVLAAGGLDTTSTVTSSAELFALNVCAPFNTPVGSNVIVRPTDATTGQQPVTLTFSDVTHAGLTTVTTSSTGPTPPPNFELGNGIYYHVETTATYSGTVTVCIDYSGTPLAGTQPVLSHYNAATGLWETPTNVTYSNSNTRACATVSSLSPFALLVPIDTTPPTVTISVTPSSLWPPNGKMVDVTVRGRMTDAGSGVDASTARFAVTDTYDQTQPSGPVSVAADGSYAVTILLPASRKGTDPGGRTFTITVSVSDRAGNAASISAVVTVPHDQSK